MRSVEMKNRCLLYYGNPVGYQTECGMVADTMFRREELEGWLARKGLSVRWEDGVYDRLSTGGYQALDHGPVLIKDLLSAPILYYHHLQIAFILAQLPIERFYQNNLLKKYTYNL